MQKGTEMMLQSILNTLFSCSHRRTTFPLTPAKRNVCAGAATARTYVVCLDCGKEFAYDWEEMRVGKAVGERVGAAEVQPIFRLP